MALNEKEMGFKPKTFRISPETYETLKDIAAKIEGNQDDVMKALIAAFEYKQAKDISPDIANNIDEFERHMNVLRTMFLSTNEMYATARQAIAAEYSAALTSKEQIILDLQAKMDGFKNAQKEAIEKMEAAQQETRNIQMESLKQSQDQKEKIDSLEKSLSDKEDFITTLRYSFSESQKKVQEMEAEHEAYQDLQKSYKAVEKDLDKLTNENKSLKAELEDAKDAQSLELQRAILDHDRQLLTKDQAIQELKAKHQAELEEMQKKYMAEIERLNHIAPNTGAEASK